MNTPRRREKALEEVRRGFERIEDLRGDSVRDFLERIKSAASRHQYATDWDRIKAS